MNKPILIFLLFSIVCISCKKTVPSPSPGPQAFALLNDSLYLYQFFTPKVIDAPNTDYTKKETYKWDWGDNKTDTGRTPTHQYVAAGNYTITLSSNGSIITKKVSVFPGTGSFNIVNAFTEPLTKVVLTSNSKTGVYPIGTILPGNNTGDVFFTLVTEYGPCIISGFVGDTTKKTVYFEWRENYLPTYMHQVFPIKAQSQVYFYASTGFFQDNSLANWMNFAF